MLRRGARVAAAARDPAKLSDLPHIRTLFTAMLDVTVLNTIASAVALEAAPLGIKVMTIEPGPFRTDAHGRSLVLAAKC